MFYITFQHLPLPSFQYLPSHQVCPLCHVIILVKKNRRLKWIKEKHHVLHKVSVLTFFLCILSTNNIYIHIYIYIRQIDTHTCYGSIPLTLMFIRKGGALSTLCTKNISGLGYLRSEDGVV